MNLKPLAPFLALVLTTACGGNEIPHCVPGALIACPYTDGGTGVQTCEDDGTWSPCQCMGGMCSVGSNEDGMMMVGDGSMPNDLAVAGPRYVFITSFTYDGNLGGLAGADSKCSTLAASAGHPGIWVAWLSDENTNALDRINDVGPWYGMGTTTIVANNKLGFAYQPISAVGRDQNGAGNTNLHGMWTGTEVGGTRAGGKTCQSWTSGSSTNTGVFVQEYGPETGGWTNFGDFPCNAGYRLVCIQQ